MCAEMKNKMEQLLIVEDDKDLNHGLCTALRDADRQTVACRTRKEAVEQLSLAAPSLVLLDINLPDGNGLELLKEIKGRYPQVPVILLTANDTDMDIVDGLEQGADDYITKPFSLSVLRARVNTQLRKKTEKSGSAHFEQGIYRFDFETLHYEADNRTVELSKTEQKLLRILVENAGNTVPREQLMDWVWNGEAEYVDENALSVTVKRLRDKLGAQDRIKTVYGIGYRWL